MLHRNDVFLLDGAKHRLLYADAASQQAWSIALEDPQAFPAPIPWIAVLELEPSASESFSLSAAIAPTPGMLRVRDNALRALGDLPNQVPAIFDPASRGPLISAMSASTGVSRPTTFKHLRRWWQCGQTPAALLGYFGNCGKLAFDASKPLRRGALPRNGYTRYALKAEDLQHFKRMVEKHYLKDARATIASTYQRLVEAQYQTQDGNGRAWVRPAGERPSLKQFEYYLRKHFSLEVRLRSRKGDKDFERENRAVLGTVLADCQGVGHYYEADATIADVYLVAEHNVNQIIGKPTLYILIDRKSRLIVGWYVGLENPSFVCAMQALLSVAQDKREICQRYGVPYDSADWPAHQVFPQQILADRGELYTAAGSQIADNLAVTVANVPSKRGDWKPVVECSFKQIRTSLQDGTPGFDPPENAKKRQGKHYEKDACLTLRQFSAIVLREIIAHNRRPLRDYPLSLKELAAGMLPSPTEIWRHNIVERAGLLPRYDEHAVRMALLPRDEATITEFGIAFRSCYYSCSEAVASGWFVGARQKGRTKVVVSYDGRLSDKIFVHAPHKRGVVYECDLTTRSKHYSGYSFAEVKAVEQLRSAMGASIEQARLQANADLHAGTDPIIAAAKKNLATRRTKVSRTARKADTKVARLAELQVERTEQVAGVGKREPSAPLAEVLTLIRPTSTSAAKAENPSDKPLTLAQRAQLARKKIIGEQ